QNIYTIQYSSVAISFIFLQRKISRNMPDNAMNNTRGNNHFLDEVIPFLGILIFTDTSFITLSASVALTVSLSISSNSSCWEFTNPPIEPICGSDLKKNRLSSGLNPSGFAFPWAFSISLIYCTAFLFVSIRDNRFWLRLFLTVL